MRESVIFERLKGYVEEKQDQLYQSIVNEGLIKGVSEVRNGVKKGNGVDQAKSGFKVEKAYVGKQNQSIEKVSFEAEQNQQIDNENMKLTNYLKSNESSVKSFDSEDFQLNQVENLSKLDAPLVNLSKKESFCKNLSQLQILK